MFKTEKIMRNNFKNVMLKSCMMIRDRTSLQKSTDTTSNSEKRAKMPKITQKCQNLLKECMQKKQK